MMRSNAPIPALMALAALSLFPYPSLARSTHHSSLKIAASSPRGRKISKHHAANQNVTITRIEAQHSLSGHHHPHTPIRPVEQSRSRATAIGEIRRNVSSPHLPSVEEVASTPVMLPSLYSKRGRLIVPPPLKGSHEILVHQNQVADQDGLDRIENDEDLLDMRSEKLLVALPASNALEVDERLPTNRRYCRPWTEQFLTTLARAHYVRFHTPLQVNSAVRTVEFQQHLMHINGNAAPAEGDTASPHLTGQAIDIAKHGLSLTEIAWLRSYLLPLVQEGRVDVEEEFQQACFHISVYKKYLPTNTTPVTSHHSATTALAAALR